MTYLTIMINDVLLERSMQKASMQGLSVMVHDASLMHSRQLGH